MSPSWDTTFMEISTIIAKRSKDESTQLGAVIVDPVSHAVLSMGYNSFPRGINDNVSERQVRPYKYMWFAHAEENAINNAALIGVSLRGATLYCRWMPCARCTRSIINSGIAAIVIDRVTGRWAMEQEDTKVALIMVQESGIMLRYVNGKTNIVKELKRLI